MCGYGPLGRGHWGLLSVPREHSQPCTQYPPHPPLGCLLLSFRNSFIPSFLPSFLQVTTNNNPFSFSFYISLLFLNIYINISRQTNSDSSLATYQKPLCAVLCCACQAPTNLFNLSSPSISKYYISHYIAKSKR